MKCYAIIDTNILVSNKKFIVTPNEMLDILKKR